MIDFHFVIMHRFQNINVPEPTVEEATAILAGLKGKYESHHKVSIDKSALEAAASMSHRYITNRRLPDKAIDLIDEACSLVRIKLGINVNMQPERKTGNALRLRVLPYNLSFCLQNSDEMTFL